MPSYKFKKIERLTNKKKFDLLFENGNVIKAFPVKIIYRITPPEVDTSIIQFAFTVPKRSFKKAVDRNFLKRRIKESFRLNKHKIYETLKGKELTISAIIIYVDREKNTYASIDKGVQKGIQKLIKAVTEQH